MSGPLDSISSLLTVLNTTRASFVGRVEDLARDGLERLLRTRKLSASFRNALEKAVSESRADGNPHPAIGREISELIQQEAEIEQAIIDMKKSLEDLLRLQAELVFQAMERIAREASERS
jgi:hypothetical protein